MQARAERTRSNILKTAKKLFAENGFAGTSVDSVAEAAKANKQRIYAYFGSKKKLFEAVLLDIFADNSIAFSRFAETVRPGEQNITFELSQYYQRLHEEHPEFHRLLTWANLEKTIDPDVLLQARRTENKCLLNWFRSEQTNQRIRNDITFESWLLTIMGTAYFASSNALTLSRTLGENFLTPAAQARRSEDLAVLFGCRK
jgi:AcrR family transcriptional regulator